MLSLDNPGTALPPLTAQTRAEAAGDIATLQIKEIVIGPEFPQSPEWNPKSQAKLVSWVEWLLGQAPLQSHDAFISYIWKDLPPRSTSPRATSAPSGGLLNLRPY